MGKKKKTNKENLIIPAQDNRICGTICICQMTLVLSVVAIVYLTVAVYIPTRNIFNADIEMDTVMCETKESAHKKVCNWTSCVEWCLGKGTGACTQVSVHLRYNGSSITFNNCSSAAFYHRNCHVEVTKNLTCLYGSCKSMTGIFNCTRGVCYNLTEAFECKFVNVDQKLNCSKGTTCVHISGLYTFKKGVCEKILAPYNCDRSCRDIPTRNKNVILMQGDNVYLTKCSYAQNALSKDEIWNDSENNVMMASCYQIFPNHKNATIEATDCVNGSVLLNRTMLYNQTNFTYLTHLHQVVAELNRSIAPLNTDLTISNDSGLKINFEGCVNTLRNECGLFFDIYGKDGSDHNAKARFPCYFSQNNVSFAYQSFDLEKEYRQFLIGFFIPTVLLIVSCFTLILCQKTVVVGDDSKMRFKCLTTEETGKLQNKHSKKIGTTL